MNMNAIDPTPVGELPPPHPNARMALTPIESKADLIFLLEHWLVVKSSRQIVELVQRLEATNTSIWADGPGTYPETSE